MPGSRGRTTCLAIAALFGAACAASAQVIDLRDHVQIAGEQILLGDLATIEGDRSEALVQVTIGPAPLPGHERTLTLGYVKLRLRRSGIDCGSLTFTGAQEVRVAGRPLAVVAPDATAAPSAEQSEVGPVPPAPVIVARGTRVRLAVECGAVRVLADATTQEEASVGALVRLRVEQTRETVSALLLSPTEALVTRE